MSYMDIKLIAAEELGNDLAETEHDIILCRLALRQGFATYGEAHSVQDRLDANLRIAVVIRDELVRRRDEEVKHG